MLSPKEKCDELYNKYYYQLEMIDKYQYLTRDDERLFTKQLAIIAIDEVIKEFEYNSSKDKLQGYWQSVKSELINL